MPPELIVRAGLRVAADRLHPAAPAESCCPSGDAAPESDSPDLQPMPGLTQERGKPLVNWIAKHSDVGDLTKLVYMV